MMRALKALFLRLVASLSGSRHDADLADELSSHLQLHIDDNLQAGMAPEEARRQALLKLGGVRQITEAHRDRRGLPAVDDLVQDIRYAARGLLRSPGFSLFAILSLTLAIGSATTMFSLLNALMWRPIDVPNADRLVQLAIPLPLGPEGGLSYPMFKAIRDDKEVLSGVFGWTGNGVATVRIDGSVVRAATLGVTGSFYSALGVEPRVGRLIGPDDEAPGAPAVAVISYPFWRSRFGGNAAVIGRTVDLAGVATRIIGVQPRAFTGLDPTVEPEIMIPLRVWLTVNGRSAADLEDGNVLIVSTAGFLRSGVSLAMARAQLAVLWPSVKRRVADTAAINIDRSAFLRLPLTVRSAATGIAAYLRAQYRVPLYATFAIALLVFLIAIVNLASLMVSRAVARDHEVAIRLALGCSRARIARHLLLDALVIVVPSLGSAVAVGTVASQAIAKACWLTTWCRSSSIHALAFAP